MEKAVDKTQEQLDLKPRKLTKQEPEELLTSSSSKNRIGCHLSQCGSISMPDMLK